MTTDQKGKIAEAQVMLKAAELGYTISVPTSQARYDMIVDTGERLFRAQVKYAEGLRNAPLLVVWLRRRGNKYYRTSEVDLLLVYSPRLPYIVALPQKEFCGKQAVTIRVKADGYKNYAGARNAEDFKWVPAA